jgi:hypothetical protein
MEKLKEFEFHGTFTYIVQSCCKEDALMQLDNEMGNVVMDYTLDPQ